MAWALGQVVSWWGESGSTMIRSLPTRSICAKTDGSSMEQNQKFRFSIPTGLGSEDDQAIDCSTWRYERSKRSIAIGTHEAPPSDSAIRSLGKRSGTRA